MATGALLLALFFGVGYAATKVGLESTQAVVAAPQSTGDAQVWVQDPNAPWRPLSVDPDGEPIRWAPCESIHWAIQLSEVATPAFAQEVQEAVDEVAAATGLSFVYDGFTDLSPDELPTQPTEDQPDVLVGWVETREQLRTTSETAVASGGSHLSFVDGGLWYASGRIRLLRITEAGGPAGSQLTLMHELGHVVGLDHPDPIVGSEVMGTHVTTRDWGPGDRAGLAAVGVQPGECGL